ncbi:DoxX family protein [Acetobacter orientalis]|uniref:DoxX family protein n=1 Tax=Acetobacter orientalis TaxID=146474 RepID=UPI0039ECFE35
MPSDRSERSANITCWVLQVLLALIFLAAASAKIAGVSIMVDTFQRIGVGQWFRYLTAIVEIVGAIALLAPAFTVIGAILLAATMAAAIVAHLTVLTTSFVPALVLLVLLLSVLWLRRSRVLSARDRLVGASS